jgi:hypothetical protein
MKKLGVPSARDVQALSERVDALSAQFAGRPAAKKVAAKAATAKKAVKRVVRKTTAKRAA